MHKTLLLLLTTSSIASAAQLPFIEDDAERARSEAVARHLPLFVDVSAPW
jgi:hypothetical protein